MAMEHENMTDKTKKKRMRDLSERPQEPKYWTRHHKAKLVIVGFGTIILWCFIMWIIQLVLKSAPTNTL